MWAASPEPRTLQSCGNNHYHPLSSTIVPAVTFQRRIALGWQKEDWAGTMPQRLHAGTPRNRIAKTLITSFIDGRPIETRGPSRGRGEPRGFQ